MSKADLSTALADAGGGRRKAVLPVIPVATEPAAETIATEQPSRAGTKPITVHYPKIVRDQLKMLAIEQDTTAHDLMGEALNMLFAKYGKAEIASTSRRS